MTSSTKWEVHNISQRCQRKTGPLSQTTCIKKLVKFSRVVFELFTHYNISFMTVP